MKTVKDTRSSQQRNYKELKYMTRCSVSQKIREMQNKTCKKNFSLSLAKMHDFVYTPCWYHCKETRHIAVESKLDNPYDGKLRLHVLFDQAHPLTRILQICSLTCVIMDNTIHCKPVCNSKRLEIT